MITVRDRLQVNIRVCRKAIKWWWGSTCYCLFYLLLLCFLWIVEMSSFSIKKDEGRITFMLGFIGFWMIFCTYFAMGINFTYIALKTELDAYNNFRQIEERYNYYRNKMREKWDAWRNCRTYHILFIVLIAIVVLVCIDYPKIMAILIIYLILQYGSLLMHAYLFFTDATYNIQKYRRESV